MTRTQFIKIELSSLKDVPFDLWVSNNGYQWSWVFSGDKKECKIILDAYLKVGVKLDKEKSIKEKRLTQ